MLIKALLVSAALVASVSAAPSICTECDDQTVGSSGYTSGGQSHSSYQYDASSSYDHSIRRSSGGSKGGRSGRYETLDENVIGGSTGPIGIDQSRPGTWQDEKHYVTDDGKGEVRYRAGQTVNGNSFSKFSEESYNYGTHNRHVPLAHSQVISNAELQQMVQNLHNHVNSFWGQYHFDANSVVNANVLANFKSEASEISNQMTNVCNQFSTGSSIYQQMQQFREQFMREVQRQQLEMQQKLLYSTNVFIDTSHFYPESTTPSVPRPTQPSRPAPIVKQPVDQQQKITEERVTEIEHKINTFYQTFIRISTDAQFKENFNSEANRINQELADLKNQAVQYTACLNKLEILQSQFESRTSYIRSHIQEAEKRQLEDQKAQLEEEERREVLRHQEQERLRAEREQKIKKEEQEQVNRLYIEEQQERIEHEEKLRIIHERKEKLRRQEEASNQRYQVENVTPRPLPQQRLPQPPQPLPRVGSTFEYNSSSTFEHNYKFHLDMTAQSDKQQQELNRLDNEVSAFNIYSMDLTPANSQRIVAEFDRKATEMRQKLESACDNSRRMHNEGFIEIAEGLKRRFEEVSRSFHNQAEEMMAKAAAGGSATYSASSGYSSHSSYGSGGSVSSVREPTISNVNYDHSKTTEVEIGGRPEKLAYGGQRVECVEAYANQPCVDQQQEQRPRQQSRRFRRQVGGK